MSTGYDGRRSARWLMRVPRRTRPGCPAGLSKRRGRPVPQAQRLEADWTGAQPLLERVGPSRSSAGHAGVTRVVTRTGADGGSCGEVLRAELQQSRRQQAESSVCGTLLIRWLCVRAPRGPPLPTSGFAAVAASSGSPIWPLTAAADGNPLTRAARSCGRPPRAAVTAARGCRCSS
jgi:hypothetical protein